MHNRLLLGPWIRRFLLEHLIAERNLSHNTQTSYRDTLVLLLQFIHAHYKKPLERLLIEDVSPEVVRMFLADIESVRSCSVATRSDSMRSAAGSRSVPDRRVAGLAQSDAQAPVAEVGYVHGDSLCAFALACAHTLPRRWHNRNRQLRDRKGAAWHRDSPDILPMSVRN